MELNGGILNSKDVESSPSLTTKITKYGNRYSGVAEVQYISPIVNEKIDGVNSGLYHEKIILKYIENINAYEIIGYAGYNVSADYSEATHVLAKKRALDFSADESLVGKYIVTSAPLTTEGDVDVTLYLHDYSDFTTYNKNLTEETILPIPLKDGYIFKGWYTTPECNEAYDFNSVIDSNITLYAGWYSASGNILYGNGGAQGRPCVVYFSALSDGTVTYSASGYKLSSSKAYDVSGKELEINSDGHIVVKTGDVICFVAYGTVNYYNSLGITVTTTCEFKDGNYATEKVTHNNYDVETNNKISIPTNVGVDFLGYFDSKGNQIVDSSGNVLSNIELIDNIKLYPKYE